MDLLHQLERIYQHQLLPRVEGNPCGSCFACCTALNHFQHRVSDLELAYVAWKVGAEAADRLARYVSRERDPEGKLTFERCPHYDQGCTIYPHRPFSCRVFGHYREVGTSFPDGCTFEGQEVEFERQGYYRIVPGAPQLRPLLREFSLLARQAPGAGSGGPPEADLSWLDADDPVDRALSHMAAHDFSAALEQLLLELELHPEGSGFLWHTLGLVYGLLERPRPALDAFRKAVALLPDHVECLSQLGSSLMLVGELAEGMQVLSRVVELEPGHGASHGLLGYAHLLQDQPEQAVSHLERALALDPGNPFYARRIEEARLKLPD